MFRFSVHPAFITVTGGIGDAGNFMRVSWRSWLPAVVVLASLQFVVYLFLAPDLKNIYYIDDYTGRTVFVSDAVQKIVPFIAAELLLAVIGLVVSWIFVATAISGLRNAPMTTERIVIRGLMTLLGSLLLGLGAIALFVPVVFAFVLSPGLGLLVGLVVIVIAIYAEIRLIFYDLAIFDGFGVIDGFRESWRLSRGSVTRLFGWGLMAALLSGVVGAVGGIAGAPFAISSQAVTQGITGLVSAFASCFIVFMMAALYESERARKDPSLYPIQPMPGYPGPYGAGPGPMPAGPWVAGQPPMPAYPAPYPTGPYGQQPYPPTQYAPGPWAPQPAPGWPAGPAAPGPGMPAPWPPYQAAPGWPGGPAAAPVWNPGAPATPAAPDASGAPSGEPAAEPGTEPGPSDTNPGASA